MNWRIGVLAAASVVGLAMLAVWQFGDTEFEWTLPDNFPRPAVPSDNPVTPVKVELGRWLFYDKRLSTTGQFSCGSCHRQELAFTDGLPRSVGATGELHPRSAMSLVNAAYASRLTWANHLLDRLEIQALTPMFSEQPVEMGMAGREDEIVSMLRNDERYQAIFAEAFPTDSDPYSILNLVRAVASFVRSIVSFDSPYDRFIAGNSEAMDAAQIRGMELFFSERLECFHCHGGFNFTDSSTHENSTIESVGFHNTGLYNIGADGDYPADNTGLFDLTGERRDMGRFKAPTLRNIELTAPYMHDGSIATLEEVVEHYAAGGRTIVEGPLAGAGNRNPYKSEFLRGFELSEAEKSDLLAFLESLTDVTVIESADYSDPWPADNRQN